ncbi:MAG: dipeptide/oligopeptide/nickel ABC transporter permease/ATP-binding protein [Streptosporangiaceae bacterium]
MSRRARARWLAVLRTPVGGAAAVLLSGVLAMAILAPLLWSRRANAIDTSDILAGPFGQHWLGTDNLGRDVFFRVLVASRLSVELALLATVIAVAAGLLLGAAPAVLGRRAGALVTAMINIAVAFPPLLLALFFAVIFGIGVKGAVLAIGFAGAPSFARLCQTLVAGVSGRDFVAAARIAGVGRVRLVTRHIMPNIAGPLVVNATIAAGSALLAFAGLSFLGLGVQAPDYDWGQLLGYGLNGIYERPAAALAPGVALVIAALAFSLLGEAAAKALGTRRVLVPGGGVLPARLAAGAGRAGAQLAAAGPDGRVAPVLTVANLRVAFPVAAGPPVTPVRGVSLTLFPGAAVGIVGESGSGKSLTALAIAALIEAPGMVTADRLEFLGTSMLERGSRARRQLLGTSLGFVFQDPMSAFNPGMRVGRQLAEVAHQHQGLGRRAALARAVDRLRIVRIPAAGRRARQYPHEFSGGMRQRAMIGMGLMGTPALIIADEPTTALDVTVQRQVLRLLAGIRRGEGAGEGPALLLISHDISVISQVCDRTLVMYAGRIVEDLPTADLRERAHHPYTRALVAAVPDIDIDTDRLLAVIPGSPADPGRLPPGCAFAPRCSLADDRCRRDDPALLAHADGRRVACWHAGLAGGDHGDAVSADASAAGDHCE